MGIKKNLQSKSDTILTGARTRDLASSESRPCIRVGTRVPNCMNKVSISLTISLKRVVGIRDRWRSNKGTSKKIARGFRPSNGAMSLYRTLEKLMFKPFSEREMLNLRSKGSSGGHSYPWSMPSAALQNRNRIRQLYVVRPFRQTCGHHQ